MHEGFHAKRLSREPLEKRFHDVWANENNRGHLLQYLLTPHDGPSKPVTARDEKVAATIIQWLGSSVGQSFLEKVKEGDGGITFSSFLQQEEKRLAEFKRWWMEQNYHNPEQFPMVLPAGTEAWAELMRNFTTEHPNG